MRKKYFWLGFKNNLLFQIVANLLNSQLAGGVVEGGKGGEGGGGGGGGQMVSHQLVD